jgi:hypothetical protein
VGAAWLTPGSSGTAGDRLWGLGVDSKDIAVSAGMGLVYDSGNC